MCWFSIIFDTIIILKIWKENKWSLNYFDLKIMDLYICFGEIHFLFMYTSRFLISNLNLNWEFDFFMNSAITINNRLCFYLYNNYDSDGFSGFSWGEWCLSKNITAESWWNPSIFWIDSRDKSEGSYNITRLNLEKVNKEKDRMVFNDKKLITWKL